MAALPKEKTISRKKRKALENVPENEQAAADEHTEIMPKQRNRAALPEKPAVVKRPDGNARTELRKSGEDSAAGNGVIVFEGDTLDLLEEGECFSRVQAGRKMGWINSAYLVVM